MKKLGILLSVASGMIAAIGTKAVNAKPMTRQEYNDFRGWQLPENENGDDECCLVEYQDATKDVSFGHAVELLKAGNRVAREGWNGKGMWLKLVSKGYFDIGCSVVEGADLLPFIGMKTADNCFVPWLASQTDVLAEDWQIVE